jgi:MurNAc alpha-1-phosphate uridylyltransferase
VSDTRLSGKSISHKRAQTVILAGGLGTRLKPLTDGRPKSMVEVQGKTFLEHQIELLREQGLTRFVLCVGHRADQIVAHFGDGASLGVEIQYSNDGASPLGTGGALVKAIPLLDSWFLVLDGDSYLPIDFNAVVAHFCERRPPALMSVYRNTNKYGRSNVAIKRGWVSVYDRKQGEFVYMHAGLTIFQREALERFAPDRFMLMDEIYQSLVTSRSLACVILRRRFYEIGSHAGLADLERYLNRRKPRPVKTKSVKASATAT